jgi:crotonobetainyl-CoA:carnitine CoA-transferase CaiB-like acyl-CoA transferase
MGRFERTYRHGPPLNGDQAAILAELAYDERAIEALRMGGAFGAVDGDDPDGRPVSEPG